MFSLHEIADVMKLHFFFLFFRRRKLRLVFVCMCVVVTVGIGVIEHKLLFLDSFFQQFFFHSFFTKGKNWSN